MVVQGMGVQGATLNSTWPTFRGWEKKNATGEWGMGSWGVHGVYACIVCVAACTLAVVAAAAAAAAAAMDGYSCVDCCPFVNCPLLPLCWFCVDPVCVPLLSIFFCVQLFVLTGSLCSIQFPFSFTPSNVPKG